MNKTGRRAAIKRSLRRTAAIALLIVMSAVPALAAYSFSDTSSNWARDFIETAASLGIINGYVAAEGKLPEFRPNNNVTRQEAMKMVCTTMLASGDPQWDAEALKEEYAGLLESCGITWAGDYASYLFSIGASSAADFPDGKGSAFALRQTIGAWMARAAGLEISPLSVLKYKDNAQISTDMLGEMFALNRYQIMIGTTAGTLNPVNNVTRAEFAKVCVRVREVQLERRSGSLVPMSFALIKEVGVIGSFNSAGRTFEIPSSGTLFQVSRDAQIIIDGVPSDFAALEALSGHFVCLSCLYGSGDQLIVQTKAAVSSGTIVSVIPQLDFSIINIRDSRGTVYSLAIADSSRYSVPRVNSYVDLITEGAEIIEIR